jgi:hypothetical protein
MIADRMPADSTHVEEQDSFQQAANAADNGSPQKLSDRFLKQHAQAENAMLNRARRGSVSAEVIKPSEQTGERVIVPKSDSAKMRIAASISNNLLFKNLEIDQKKEVVRIFDLLLALALPPASIRIDTDITRLSRPLTSNLSVI